MRIILRSFYLHTECRLLFGKNGVTNVSAVYRWKVYGKEDKR